MGLPGPFVAQHSDMYQNLMYWFIYVIQRIMTKTTVKPVLSVHSKRTPKIGFQYQLSFNAGQKFAESSKESILQYV